MKRMLPIAMCAVLLISCASKRAGVVDSAITEATTLQALSKTVNLEVPANADSLITAAEKQKNASALDRLLHDRQTEAFVLADEAILQYQLSMLKQEEAALAKEKQNAESDLATSKESLDVYRDVLDKQKNAPKQVGN